MDHSSGRKSCVRCIVRCGFPRRLFSNSRGKLRIVFAGRRMPGDQMGNDGEARSDREYGGGPSVEEIHVDFLLWEELQASRLFAREFAKYCTKTSDYDETILPVQHSVMDDLGESDLIFRYRNQAGESVAILIEDKIGAPLQRQQAERYRKRGARGVPKSWDRFLTCIVAPERYLQWVEGFDVSLPLETIIE